jgi:hypothetical protein
LQPTLELGHPNREEELTILKYHLPFADEEMLNLTVEFLQQSHELKLDYSTRDGINVLRYALKQLMQNPEHPLGKDGVWQKSLVACLGDEALDLQNLSESRQQSLGGGSVPMGLADFFFSPDNPLHPDYREDDDDEDEDY